MNTARFVAAALIVAGIFGLVYGGFTYTKDRQAAKVGPIELTVEDKKTVNIPVWVGIGAIVAGGALLFLRTNRT